MLYNNNSNARIWSNRKVALIFAKNEEGIVAKETIASKVSQALQPIISKLGYELVKVDYSKKVDGFNMTIYIDKPEGITLSDCEKVHKAIDAPLDELDPTDGSYTLNVSSCGLDWPIKTDGDFQRNLGNVLDISLFSPIESKKNYTGTLVEFDNESITIEDKNQTKLPRAIIAKAVRHIEF